MTNTRKLVAAALLAAVSVSPAFAAHRTHVRVPANAYAQQIQPVHQWGGPTSGDPESTAPEAAE